MSRPSSCKGHLNTKGTVDSMKLFLQDRKYHNSGKINITERSDYNSFTLYCVYLHVTKTLQHL